MLKIFLMKVVRNNKIDVVICFIRVNCNMNIMDRNYDMVLYYVFRNGCVDVIDILIFVGSLIDVQNYWGCILLMEVVCYNYKEVVVRFFKVNCDLN